MMEKLSMSPTEHDKLREKQPERYWRWYYFLIEREKAEKRELDKIKAQSEGYSGKADIVRFEDE